MSLENKVPIDWLNTTLGEVGKLARGKSKHRPRWAPHLFGGKYPFIQTGQVKSADKYIKNYEQTYSEAGLAQSKLWEENTLCITIAANIAEIAILKFPACFPDSVLGFLADENKCDLNFIYYNFSMVQAKLRMLAIGSVQDNINLGTFEKLQFLLPPLQEQKAIANVLTAFDDKIELLQQQNQTLETIAQTIFKKWFGKYQLGDELPDGWRVGKITELFEVRDGTHDSPKQCDNGKILITSRHITNERIKFEEAYFISKTDFDAINQRSAVEQYDILFSMIGTLGLTYFEQNSNIDYAIKNLALFKTSQNRNWAFYTYLWLTGINGKHYILKNKSGSTQEFLSLGSLRDIDFIIPEMQVLESFNNVCNPIFEKLRTNSEQIQSLTKTRDTLLPKLMSGQVRVKI